MSSTNPAPASDLPQYIGVECHTCGTRMYGRPEDVGRKLKCPDCGARTVLPAPVENKASSTPAAMEGEQYELWEPDDQPAQIAAAQPKYIAVRCTRCETLMYATEAQVGATIACPDCGRKHVVPPPAKPKPKRSVMAMAADTPVLDPDAAPGERPTMLPVTTRGMAFEEEADAAYAQAKAKSLRTGKPMTIDARGRPIMPRWPLLFGILSFPFSHGCIARCAALALGLILAAGLILDGVPHWLNWTGGVAGAKEAFGGLIETIFAIVCLILWVAAASNVFIAIVSQSAVGNDRIAEWPPLNFIASMSEMLPITAAIIFTAAPGLMLGQFLAQESWHLALFGGASLLLGFPISHLSQLAGNSTWNLIDLKILSAMIRCPISMLLAYLESAFLAAICIAAAFAVAPIHDMLPLALAPLYVGSLMIYARILGRLAWRLSEKMPEDVAHEV